VNFTVKLGEFQGKKVNFTGEQGEKFHVQNATFHPTVFTPFWGEFHMFLGMREMKNETH
jgi:hypothetical protein